MKANRRRLLLTDAEVRGDQPIDIRFDGHRVWSTTAPGAVDGVIRIPWPEALRSRLHGVTDLSVHDTVQGDLLTHGTVRFGRSGKRLAITDKRGNWLAMSKWDRLGPSLEGSDEVATRLIESAARLAALMQEWGYPIYLVGGTLLGMVRGGALLPHDDDLDFAYLSQHSEPADLVRESFELERRLTDAGYAVARHSHAHLELAFFDEHGELDHYIDVFTGFFHEGLYCQPFALRSDEVVRDDLVPTRDIDVNGVALPAPANPQAWLAYAYGPGWRIPDPSFVFQVPSGTKHRFESWFGVFNRGRFHWEKHWQGKYAATGSPGGAGAAKRLLEIMPPGSDVLDLGCGDGRWTQELQDAGHRVVGVDYSFEALRVAKVNDRHRSTLWRINANDRTALLELGANLLDTGRPWYVLCTDVLHGLTFTNRENVYLMLRMVLRGPGRAVVTFDTHATMHYLRADPRTWHYSLRQLEEELAEDGLEIEHVHRGVRRTEMGWRRYAQVVIRRSDAAPAERVAWIHERDENVA